MAADDTKTMASTHAHTVERTLWESEGLNNPEIAPYRLKESPPPDKTFDIGLVLAGAISAGAYSAGVVDFLIEALDAWEDAKANGLDVPVHKVRLRVVAGASAGSMNGAIASVALQYAFIHVRHDTPVDAYTNPFYESWVKRIDIKYLLESKDLSNSPVLQSILDSVVLDQITNDALDTTAAVKQRPYLGDGVRYIFSQGGLRGIPYYISMNGPASGGLAMSLHKTYRSFSVSYGGISTQRRPDDTPLQANFAGRKSNDVGWKTLGNAALGSGAFPLGLSPRFESRNPVDLQYRYVVIPDGKGGLLAAKLDPAWTLPIGGTVPSPPTQFNEFVVDGGTMDNEPLDMARTELAGLTAYNERDGDLANRGIVMIDPFPDVLQDFATQPSNQSNLVASAFGLAGAWKNQARFNPVDLALAADSKVYSRYLIAPSRKDDGSELEKASNGFHIASGALGGFSGFLSEEYRRHDYLLGRRNCQQFLSAYFSLPPTNSNLFPQEAEFRKKWSIASTGEIPIVPLMAHLRLAEPLPPWPSTAVDLDELRKGVDYRLGKVVNAALDLGGFKFKWLEGLVAGIVIKRLKNFALEKSLATTRKALIARNLKVR